MINISRSRFINLFYFFSGFFVIDFLLMLFGGLHESCEDCSWSGFIVMVLGLGFFWLWSWHIMYVAFFMKKEISLDKKSFFIKKLYFAWVRKIQNSVRNDNNPLLTRVTAVLMMLPFCFGVLYIFFKLCYELIRLVFYNL